MTKTISIIIATLNSERTLEACLRSIRLQNYPQKDIEILLVDSGSIDRTLILAKKYHCRIIKKAGVELETAKSYGLQKARHELIADFGSDNILPDKDWLKKITQPFVNSDIIASYPLRYTFRKTDTIFNRYVALFGVNDPVPFYLGKADRQSALFSDFEYKLAGKVKNQQSYFEVDFTIDNLPTVGANGFLIRKKILEKALVKPEDYFHIDVIFDLVKLGFRTFAVVKTSIIHDTAENLLSLLKKRQRYFSELYLQKITRRRYHVVDKKDYGKLLLFVIYSLTFIQPLMVSLKGFRKKPDLAWFIHPLFCYLITIIYVKEVLKIWLRKIL